MNPSLSRNVSRIDHRQIQARELTSWAGGDYAVAGNALQMVSEELCESVNLCQDERVLDVAAGTFHASLAAARRWCEVTSTDYVAQLLEKGAVRAGAEGLAVTFRVADAEALPFDDGDFDVALSTFGAMFTPDHVRPAREMLRVVRSGGRIGLANWTPEGFIGRLFKVVGAYVPPPAGLKSPALWGTEPHIVELFGKEALDIRTTRRHFNFRYRSAAHWIQVFRDFYGPVHMAFKALDPAGQEALERDITALLEECNVAGPDFLVVPGEYLEVVVVKK